MSWYNGAPINNPSGIQYDNIQAGLYNNQPGAQFQANNDPPPPYSNPNIGQNYKQQNFK